MSTHAIEIIEVGAVEPHPNADRMEITRVWGWQCCVGKGQFHAGDRAVYVPPDFVVPTDRASFAFLKKEGRERERISVRRFRGQWSQGLLIPVPDALADRAVGENVIDELGIERYEPPAVWGEGVYVKTPVGMSLPKFDVENYQRYPGVLAAGEEVYVTEKIHGANARYVVAVNPETGEFEQYCGSRTNWVADDGRNFWWRAFHADPSIGRWCAAHPDVVLYGEVYGNVQHLRYGTAPGEVRFAAFAALDHGRWLDYAEFAASVAEHGVAVAPLVYHGPFDEAKILELAEGDSRVPGANHLAEGVVIVPAAERASEEVGRVALKVVSNRYLES